MRRYGPLATLVAGALLAVVLTALSSAAATDTGSGVPAWQATSGPGGSVPSGAASEPAGTATATPTGTPAGPPAASAPATDTPAEPAGEPLQGPVTFAGEVNGNGGLLAIAARDGEIVAYLCDGRRTEAWLRGTAAGGRLEAAGKNATLTGTYRADVATGTVSVGAARWTFRISVVRPPSGLYRASQQVRDATVVAGWVVYKGRQVGAYTVDGGAPSPAPALDLASNTAVIDGTTLTAAPVEPGRTN